MPKTKTAEAKVEEQVDPLAEFLADLNDKYWRIAGAVENMSESIEEINKELFRLTHLLEEQLKKK